MPRDDQVTIEADWILADFDGSPRLLRDGEVVVRGDLIEEVRERRSGGKERIRIPGQLLLPGLISAHTHSAAGTAGRGLAEHLNPWFGDSEPASSGGSRLAEAMAANPLRPMELMAELDDEDLDDLTTANLVEMLRSGCTTQVEMALDLRQAQSYVRVAGRLGLRGYPAAMIPALQRVMPIWGRSNESTLVDSVSETFAEIDANLDFGLKANGSFDDRIRPMMAITVTVAHTRKTLLAISAAAQQLGNGIHMHVQGGAGRNHVGPDLIVQACGKPEIPLLAELGILQQRIFGAHLIGADLERDLPLLAKATFTFAHCPSAGGAALSPATQPYPEALAAGVNTAIGLDAHSADLIENLKQAVIQGRARTQFLAGSSPVPMLRPSMMDAVGSATAGAAHGLGRDDLGRLAPGAKADLCSVDVAGLFTGSGSTPLAPLNNLLYASGLSVRNVMTNGVWQVVDGSLVVDDEVRVLRRRRAVMDKLHAMLADEGFDPVGT